MLELKVILSESFNEKTNEFIQEEFLLELEHSLVSLSKWESKHEKPFLSDKAKTDEETLDYIRMMILTPEYPEDIIEKLCRPFNAANMNKISEYMNAKMTATWFNEVEKPNKPSREKITAELIYYWIVSYQIPWDVENWHINRLFTLIKVFNAKNSEQKKMNPKELAAHNRRLNDERRAKYGTSG